MCTKSNNCLKWLLWSSGIWQPVSDDDDMGSFGPMTPFFHHFPPPCCGTASWPLLSFSPPTFILLKFSRALSICGVSIQPVSVREPLLLSALLCAVMLPTSGDLPSPNLYGSTPDPPRMFKLLQETEPLDLFIQLPRLRRDTQCLQLQPATQ